MSNVTTSEYAVRVTRLHAIGPDLTAEEIGKAVQDALIAKLGYTRGYTNVREALERGELRIEVEE